MAAELTRGRSAGLESAAASGRPAAGLENRKRGPRGLVPRLRRGDLAGPRGAAQFAGVITHCWLTAPVQVHCWTATPSTAVPEGTAIEPLVLLPGLNS